MKHLLLPLLLLIAAFGTRADSVEALMLRAADAMSAGRYHEAAGLYAALADTLRPQVADGDDEAVRSLMKFVFNEAGCRYMLDDYLSLAALADTLEAFPARFTASFADPELLQDLTAYAAKLRGSVEYGNTDSDPRAYARAEEAYLRALDTVWEGDTDFIAVVNRELAQLYYKQGRYDDALRRLTASFPPEGPSPLLLSQQAIVEARVAAADTTDNAARVGLERALALINQAIAAAGRNPDPEMLRKKAKIMMIADQRLDTDHYHEARHIYERYLAGQKQLVARQYATMTPAERRQAWLALHAFLYDCWRLGPRAADLAYDLALYTKGYLLRPASARVPGWEKVRKALAPGEAAVEFAVVDGRLKAVVLGPNRKAPTMVDVASVDSLMGHKVVLSSTVERFLTSTKAADKDRLYADTALFAAIWAPVLDAVGRDLQRIYFAADGPLHHLAIEYMLPEGYEDTEAVRLSSTARLLDRRSSADILHGSMLTVGGLKYSDSAPTDPADGNDATAYDLLVRSGWSSVKELPYSRREVERVASLRARGDDCLLSDTCATEARVLAEVTRHPVALFSTHGFFGGAITAGTDLKPAIDDSSLSQSGLMLSGAERSLRDSAFSPSAPDGVLSAAEIAAHDWSNLGLAVLSACQTGLGYITADGVYGLQRGLKMAGVGAMVVSLWEVADEATFTLMSCFFEELARDGTTSPRAAFTRARARLISGDDTPEAPGAPSALSARTLARTPSRPVEPSTPHPSPYHNCAFIAIDLF